jgi:hypothetical protein
MGERGGLGLRHLYTSFSVALPSTSVGTPIAGPYLVIFFSTLFSVWLNGALTQFIIVVLVAF